MKKTFIIAAVCIFNLCVVANAATAPVNTNTGILSVNATPPAAVLASFHSNFGNVAVREWKQRSHGEWRAHFRNHGVAWEATFNSSGVLVKSEPA